MLIYTYLELYYIYVLYDIIYLLQSVPPSGSVFFLNKRIEYQKTVVRLAYIYVCVCVEKSIYRLLYSIDEPLWIAQSKLDACIFLCILLTFASLRIL